MTMRGRLGVLATIAIAGALTLPGGPAMAVGSHGSGGNPPSGYTCTGGEIPTGDYASITVMGDCSVVADAVVSVAGNIDVRKGAALDAQSVPSTITVGGSVKAAKDSFLGLGCQPPSLVGNSAHTCFDENGEPTEGHSTITVKGNITVTGADVVLLNGITVKGNVSVIGGGSEIPWSIKNNTIGRNITVGGQETEWLGVMFNKIGGNATLVRITLTETHPGASGAVYVVSNTIGRNLICTGLSGVSPGFVPGAVNTVGGHAIGQCKDVV